MTMFDLLVLILALIPVLIVLFTVWRVMANDYKRRSK